MSVLEGPVVVKGCEVWEMPFNMQTSHWDITVAGAGGNGTQIISGLARMNVALLEMGHPGMSVTVYDADRVSEANVGRQLFSKSDIGMNKAEVMVNRMNMFYGFRWKAVDRMLTELRYGSSNQILITCVDTAAARRKIAEECGRLVGYWLDIGNGRFDGQVVLGELHTSFFHSKDFRAKAGVSTNEFRVANIMDYFPEMRQKSFQEDDTPSCSLREALRQQDLFVNQACSTFALNLLWRFFMQGKLDYHGAFINLATGIVNPLPVKWMKSPEPPPSIQTDPEDVEP